MPNRSSKKRPRDINQFAATIADDATREGAPTQPEAATPARPEKNPHAQALGRLGGLKGGKARAAKLTPEERTEIAKKAAATRWGKSETS